MHLDCKVHTQNLLRISMFETEAEGSRNVFMSLACCQLFQILINSSVECDFRHYMFRLCLNYLSSSAACVTLNAAASDV